MKEVNKNETSDIFKIKKNKENKYFFQDMGSEEHQNYVRRQSYVNPSNLFWGSLFRLDLCHYSG